MASRIAAAAPHGVAGLDGDAAGQAEALGELAIEGVRDPDKMIASLVPPVLGDG